MCFAPILDSVRDCRSSHPLTAAVSPPRRLVSEPYIFRSGSRGGEEPTGKTCGLPTQGLEQRNIYGVIGYRTPTQREGYFYKREYRYDEKLDVYLCPNGQLLHYRTTNREDYRQYHSDPNQCRLCPVRHKCTQSSNATKVVTRHVWESSKERTDQYRFDRIGKRIYKRSKETVERSFADAKQLHGHRYARMRGRSKVQQQCLPAATAQNIKKIALLLSQTGPDTPLTTLLALLDAYTAQLLRYQKLNQTAPTVD
jgi:hypothetical protein